MENFVFRVPPFRQKSPLQTLLESKRILLTLETYLAIEVRAVMKRDKSLRRYVPWVGEVILSSRDQVGWTLWVTHVRLYRNDVDTMGALQRGSKLGTGLGGGIRCIAEDERSAFRGKITGDGSANSSGLRFSSYEGAVEHLRQTSRASCDLQISESV